jgi:hypothetical protein
MTKRWTTPQEELKRWGEEAHALDRGWCEQALLRAAQAAFPYGSPCGGNEFELSHLGHRMAVLVLCAAGLALSPMQIDG